MTIEVQDRESKPGVSIACALVGPEMNLFEIRLDGDKTHYYVDHTPVDRQTYLDALATLDADRFDPDFEASPEEVTS